MPVARGCNVSVSLSCVKKQRMPPRAELIQKCIFASELFTYRWMIMISRLICDKICRSRSSFGALEGTCFFPCWPLAQQRLRFTTNTLIATDTYAAFSLASSRLSSQNPVRQQTGNRCPRFVLASVAGVLDSGTKFLCIGSHFWFISVIKRGKCVQHDFRNKSILFKINCYSNHRVKKSF